MLRQEMKDNLDLQDKLFIEHKNKVEAFNEQQLQFEKTMRDANVTIVDQKRKIEEFEKTF